MLVIVSVASIYAEEFEPLPSDPYFAPFKPIKAPPTKDLLLKQGDRLAICGDSITEQKMYSRIMETYLTVCVPELKITVRQYGWSGEVAPFFRYRMENDVLRFNPTIATTCYGMNDHRYQPYKFEFGRTYRENSQAIIHLFKEHGVRVIQGSPGSIGRMLKTLEQSGELDNTIVVVTSDNGMPFPRAKATAYNYGVHMPLAIRWPNGINKPGRMIKDFVNHIDFAPTFLEAAGLKAPSGMTGRSLMNLFKSGKSGLVVPARTMTVTGLERHVWTRPDGRTYPRRVIHTRDFVYIRNYEPDRWPMGGPDFVASHQGTYGDIDAGPTKSYMMAHKDDERVKELFDKSFAKLPAEELYAIDKDPAQMNDLADNPKFKKVKEKLKRQLEDYQKKTNDPRIHGKSPWDDYPFYSGTKYLKGKYLEEVQAQQRKK